MVGDPSGFSTLLSRSDILRNVLGLAAAGGSFRGGAAIAQIGYPALPPLTGPYDTIGCRYTRVNGYATQGSNPGLADTRQACHSHVRASPWTARVPRSSTRRAARQARRRPTAPTAARPRTGWRDWWGSAACSKCPRLYTGASFRCCLPDTMPSATAAPCRLPAVPDPNTFGRAGPASSCSPFHSAT